ncbi:WSC domain-containing protein 2-like [Haliotis rufescens]|uniref:WSC domain-containing protein 2-like n=1 Tax=Haliotis rufescens TaxID=6454 RepID=UPI001EAFFFB7|nr:WSC domain-containing protein 2-like [Haliotis rufescens]
MNDLVSTAVVCLIVSAVHVTADLGGSSLLGYIKVYSPGTGFPKYMGCYLDDSSRMIGAGWLEEEAMTHGMCFKLCSRGRHKYAGLQGYTHCLCGDSVNIVRYPKKPESDCNQPCKGNTSEICGGDWRNSLYRLF